MHRCRPSLRSTRGFTLLELLIATAVSAIVLLAINTTFFGALRLHNTTHEKIDSDLTQQREAAGRTKGWATAVHHSAEELPATPVPAAGSNSVLALTS